MCTTDQTFEDWNSGFDNPELLSKSKRILASLSQPAFSTTIHRHCRLLSSNDQLIPKFRYAYNPLLESESLESEASTYPTFPHFRWNHFELEKKKKKKKKKKKNDSMK